MENFLSFFNINTIMFTVLNYPMSYLEFFGTVANLLCVYLAAKHKILTWPVGLVGVIFYLFLFYQIRLYSDFFEQIYFFFASFYGWILWKNSNIKTERKIEFGSVDFNVKWIFIIMLMTSMMWIFMINIHVILPKLFPEPASYPFLDAFTTVMSFAAMILMSQKKILCWWLWIIVDIIGIWLYYVKGVKFISLEYLIFLFNGVYGLLSWSKLYHIQHSMYYKNK
jgi:nicotinamide mononucleotide transporter